MNTKGQVTVGVLIVIVMGVLAGLAMFNASADSVGQMTTKQVTSNQSNDVTTAYLTNVTVNTSLSLPVYTQSAWKQIDCPLTSVSFRNGAGTALVSATDYVLDASAGTYTLKDTAKTQPVTSLNLTYVDYTYCADGYNKNSGSRSIANLIMIFMALALLGFVIEQSGVASFMDKF